MPTYFYAGPLWNSAVSGSAAVGRTLILNPASGPGTQQDPNYVAAVDQARAAGARVIGYVHTPYGTRPADAVLSEIAKYEQWYGVMDIIFDEASSLPAYLSYYQSLSHQVRAASGLVILNPGVYPDEGYMATADRVVTFEGTFDSYRQAQSPTWAAGYPAQRFVCLVYATSTGQLNKALSLAAQRGAGNVYVTDDSGANPWDTLPSYWSAEVQSLSYGSSRGHRTMAVMSKAAR